MTEEGLQDPMKALSEILEPDPRQKYFMGSLEEIHRNLLNISLSESVPIAIRQQFETAKNLSLYSWFVYRFHQVAELAAFTTFEMALRTRYFDEVPQEDTSKKRPPTLYQLMQYAQKQSWITNECFSNLSVLAKNRVETHKTKERLKTHDFEKHPEMVVEEATDLEIEEELKSLDRLSGVAKNINKIRNNLAHGSTILHPHSISTLRDVSDMVNELFS